MSGARAAIRYAKAILSLATDKKSAESVNNDMKLMANTMSENIELNDVLTNAVIKAEVKKAVLLKIFPKLNSISTDLFDVLITNKRVDILPEIAIQYSVLFDAVNGKEKAKVTTAIPMTKELEAKVLDKVRELTNKEVTLENIVDESIIGGFILRVGDKQYNASISNKLNKLKREFTLN
ncbi:MAG: ATP synthase F1 subunit delta [Flavobacteriales bacterium]|nr:ATP synthase F1 subunit delta [Flavobacteriia bacterium]NCP04859.1 ATP synthase F1 subunit delta [Flavobacteriales bacterium]PIV94301.1 MAG: ATP synthase F1 subunit delta [Flavobacteriaceae bacterium CG17_big_fil_post_rev_8_21_14_2_50_33_15]PIY11972.1 MAG: ATP synthase F1 subunit delta [Flavobacteriaceae bacterium CG_4_10_14_3_um_filter_33_47]PJB16208.1 MAG: ATP synthase F1 subunit delta [Flavobacteriaceae bacterium CG_4_9_14_3_um_filter_33_16]